MTVNANSWNPPPLLLPSLSSFSTPLLQELSIFSSKEKGSSKGPWSLRTEEAHKWGLQSWLKRNIKWIFPQNPTYVIEPYDETVMSKISLRPLFFFSSEGCIIWIQITRSKDLNLFQAKIKHPISFPRQYMAFVGDICQPN